MYFIKIYIKKTYINCYHTSIQMCGQYCILAPRGSKSSNRIELSLGGFRWVGGIWRHGDAPTCTHSCVHAYTHTHTQRCSYPKIYMYRNCKWRPSWVSCLACLTCACVCMCVHVCACIWEHPYTPRYSHLPAPHWGLKSVKMQ